ncbi:MAG: matrixin family metalloprotease [Candidatus Uhrbacteria bacterium]|nr:matrixin family metalloprotease [Candidatus Uhrbacteria bacterium]
MRKYISDIFFLVILLALAFYFRDPLSRLESQFLSRTFPCQQPIAYSIGTFDSRFGISKDVFIKDIQKAESVWEKPIGKDLFVYKPDLPAGQAGGALKINLVYDERQIATQKLAKYGIAIHDDQATYDTLKGKYDVLQKSINTLKALYQTQSNAYDVQLAAYNKEITYWNQHDHVTQTTVDRLNVEKADLDQQQLILKDLENKVNANVDELNALVEVVNRLAKSLNLAAIQYNTIGASQGSEFEEGEYVSDPTGNHINIYQFDDQAKLIRVLTHEMGHAIGLGHLENPKAIMYRRNNGVNATLTVDDLAAIKKQCRIK